jgi:hypothetical protein
MNLPIKELLQESHFPDCLGHLGIILSMTEYIEKKDRTLTKALIPQFLELLDRGSYTYESLNNIIISDDKCLNYKDLE